MDTYYAYHVAACDQGWLKLPTVDSEMSVTKTSALWETIKKAAIKVGWDGKFQNEPCLFFLPDEDAFHTAVAWKQENNGDLIVVSPIELPWLQKKAQEYGNDNWGEFTNLDFQGD